MVELPAELVRPRHADTAPPSWLWPEAPRRPEAMKRLNWLAGYAERRRAVAVVGVDPQPVHEVDHVCRSSQIETSVLAEELAGHALVVIAGQPPEAMLPELREMAAADRVLFWRTAGMRLDPSGAAHVSTADQLLAELDQRQPRLLTLEPRNEALCLRHFVRADEHWLVLFNSGADPIDSAAQLSIPGRRTGVDPQTGEGFALGDTVRLLLPAKALALLRVESEF